MLAIQALMGVACADSFDEAAAPEPVRLRQEGRWAWELIDANPATVQIAADARGHVYQRHRDGSIFQLGGGGNWFQYDNNPQTKTIAANENGLVQQHYDGSIWVRVYGTSSGPPYERSWNLLGEANRSVVSVGLKNTDSVFRYLSTGAIEEYDHGLWRLRDNNPATNGILIGSYPGGTYQYHRNGVLWEHAYDSVSKTKVWVRRSAPTLMAQVAADMFDLYRLELTGTISKYVGPKGAVDGNDWQVLDNSPASAQITVCERSLFQRHHDGAIFALRNGRWVWLDGNPRTKFIVCAGKNRLIQLHDNGEIWQLYL